MPRNLYPREYVPAKRFGEFWLDIAADTSKDGKRERGALRLVGEVE